MAPNIDVDALLPTIMASKRSWKKPWKTHNNFFGKIVEINYWNEPLLSKNQKLHGNQCGILLKTIFLVPWYCLGIVICEHVNMNMNMNLWTEVGRNIPNICHPCQMEYSLIDFMTCQNILWQTNIPPHQHKLTHCHCHMDLPLCSIKCEYITLPRFVPHVLKHKKVYGAFLKRSCSLKLQRTHI
jgi:hypothetical protein